MRRARLPPWTGRSPPLSGGEVAFREQLPLDRLAPKTTNETIPQRVVECCSKITMNRQRPQSCDELGDRFAVILLPSVEPETFHDEKRFGRQVRFQNSVDLRQILVRWIVWCDQASQQGVGRPADQGQKRSYLGRLLHIICLEIELNALKIRWPFIHASIERLDAPYSRHWTSIPIFRRQLWCLYPRDPQTQEHT